MGAGFKTFTDCDSCKMDNRAFRIIHDFLGGLEYASPYGEHFVQFCVKEMIEKYGPKSSTKYPCISFYRNEVTGTAGSVMN